MWTYTSILLKENAYDISSYITSYTTLEGESLS